jgi:hypothetical protein
VAGSGIVSSYICDHRLFTCQKYLLGVKFVRKKIGRLAAPESVFDMESPGAASGSRIFPKVT